MPIGRRRRVYIGELPRAATAPPAGRPLPGVLVVPARRRRPGAALLTRPPRIITDRARPAAPIRVRPGGRAPRPGRVISPPPPHLTTDRARPGRVISPPPPPPRAGGVRASPPGRDLALRVTPPRPLAPARSGRPGAVWRGRPPQVAPAPPAEAVRRSGAIVAPSWRRRDGAWLGTPPRRVAPPAIAPAPRVPVCLSRPEARRPGAVWATPRPQIAVDRPRPARLAAGRVHPRAGAVWAPRIPRPAPTPPPAGLVRRPALVAGPGSFRAGAVWRSAPPAAVIMPSVDQCGVAAARAQRYRAQAAATRARSLARAGSGPRAWAQPGGPHATPQPSRLRAWGERC